VLSLPIVALIAAITLGLYLLISLPKRSRSTRWKWGLRGGCGLLFLILTILLNGKNEGWPQSHLDGWVFGFAFWLLAMTNVLAAAWTILSGDVRQSVRAFGVSVLSFLCLLCLLEAWLIAGSLLLIVVVAVACYFRFLQQAVCRRMDIEPPVLSTEPLMACIAGGLLMLGLFSAGRADVVAGVFFHATAFIHEIVAVQQETQPMSAESHWADQGLNFVLLSGITFVSGVFIFLFITESSLGSESSSGLSDAEKIVT